MPLLNLCCPSLGYGSGHNDCNCNIATAISFTVHLYLIVYGTGLMGSITVLAVALDCLVVRSIILMA